MFKKAMRKSKSIAGASFILASAALLSGLLGLIRNRLLASRFGAGSQLDIYFASFRIPDFLSTVLITGALSVAVIPLFNYYRNRSQKEGWQFISALFRWSCFFLIVLSLLLMILTPWLSKWVVPGFNAVQVKQMITMTRIMLLSPLLLGLSMILSSVLQSLRHFVVSSLAPVFYNAGIIFGILFFVPHWGLTGLAWGVVLGSFLHCAIQWPALLACHFQYHRFFADQMAALKKLFRLGLPRTMGVSANQLNILVMTSLASMLSVGSISVYNFAADISQFLTRLIGVSFTTAAFPLLALSVSRKQKKEFLENFSSAFRQIFYLVVPASFLVFILRAHIVRIFLGVGHFDWVDTRLTAACLGILSLSVFAQSLVTLISRAFAAWHDTRTPARISIGTVVLNIILSVVFINLLGQTGGFSEFWRSLLKLQGIADIRILGLTLAFSLTAIIQLIWLLTKLDKKMDGWTDYFHRSTGVKLFLALTLMTLTTYAVLYISVSWFNTSTLLGLMAQTSLAGFGGLLVYFLTSWKLHSSEWQSIYQGVKAEFKKDDSENS